MVAMQSAQGFVDHQRNVAAFAERNVATLGTLVRGRVATPVLKQDDLPSLLHGGLHLVAQHLAEPTAHAPLLVFLAQVRHKNLR